ncbi:N-acetylmuramidase family protein [Vibrio bivalvicida]|uniref:N-acetylmuramidase domain-containing protein n=1 Tax=Vibrio bivalvicida TaxID=1276888 RepID=A0A177XX98_9VIBR|nr:N-acetylmuramidase family protein [Vibrio bivalvicida]OAJ93219.1 hypothetical protein APB76_14745 [Vibrio bivalvicida]
MNTIKLVWSVGKSASNVRQDVLSIQNALNLVSKHIGLKAPLREDGEVSSDVNHSPTCLAIGLLQRNILHFKHPDYRIDVGGKSHLALQRLCQKEKEVVAPNFHWPNVTPQIGLCDQDFENAAMSLGCDIAAIKAVSDVESNGSGFLKCGKPRILFEAHKFSKYTQHKFDDSHPKISSKKWQRGLYLGGEKEYGRLQEAIELDSHAALLSTSFGRYQIMGFNYQAAGYNSVEDFVSDMFLSESKHLQSFVSFIQSNSQLHRALKAKNWPYFASLYNGPDYAQNSYDKKLERAYLNYA